MEELFFTLNQPWMLFTLFGGAIALVLIDYIFPVDWPAYVGYILFSIFIGATVPFSPVYSIGSMFLVALLMLTLHKGIFSRFLTNAPHLENRRSLANDHSVPGNETDSR